MQFGSGCNVACLGNITQKCGGTTAASVYRTTGMYTYSFYNINCIEAVCYNDLNLCTILNFLETISMK